MNIDIIIIGLNSEKTLSACLQSVLKANYQQSNLHVYYIDGGSSDSSIEIAKNYLEVTVQQLVTEFPTPGLGRNTGWKAGSSPLVLFLDADTQLDANFLSKAVWEISHPHVGAVKGYRKELYPQKSLYIWIGDQEWNDRPGESLSFGGDVLMRREVLEATQGYKEELIAGEDPELSLRVRDLGWIIIQLDILMCYHDLAMTSLQQYFWRAYRSGYGFANVYHLHQKYNGIWKNEMQRIIIRGGGGLGLLFCSVFTHGLTAIPGLLLLLYPRLFKVQALSQSKHLTSEEAKIYAWHCSFVVIPQFLGVMRFYMGRLCENPLRNKSMG